MSPIYRPSQFSSVSSGGDTSPATGTHELGQAGLTANVETQLPAQTDIRNAHQFFQPHVDAGSVAGHAVVAQPIPGADQAVLAAVGANEPFSPLIQLIMRMPGQIGLLSSFFEALGSWLFPHLDFVAGFDPSVLAQQAEASMNSLPDVSLEHTPIDLSLLPDDAPIFQSLEDGNGILPDGGLTDSKLSGLLGRSSETFGPLKDPLKVSGQFSLSKPQYESWGQSGSFGGASGHGATNPGTSLSEGLNSDPASHHGWFTDRLTDPNSPASAAGSSTSVGSQLSPTSSLNSPASSLNVGADAFSQQAEALPAVAQIKEGLGSSQTAGFSSGFTPQTQSIDPPKLGPSGAVSDQLGSKQVMANSDDAATFRPTLSGMDNSTYDSSSLGSDYATSRTSTGHHLHGLKAKALNLDGLKHSEQTHAKLSHNHNTHQGASTGHTHQQHKPVIDHIGYQSRGGIDHIGHQSAGNIHSNLGHYRGGQAYDHIGYQSKGTIGGAHHTSNGAVYDQIAHRQPFNHSHYFKPRSLAEFESQPKAQATFVTQDQSAVTIQDSTGDTRFVSQVAPETQVPTTYTIRAGDCLWNISRDHLSSAVRWPEIYRMNADLLGANPNLIHPGVTIKLPSAGSELTSASKYIVRSGDNLWNISQHFSGHGERWGELYRLNGDVIGANPRLIFPGQELTIPGIGEPTQTVAEAADAASGGIASANVGTASGTTQLTSATSNQLAQAAPNTQTAVDYQGSGAPGAQHQGSELNRSTGQGPEAGDSAPDAHQQSMPGPGAAQAATPSDQANTQAAGSTPKASLPANQSSVVSSSLLPDLTSLLRKK